MCRRKPGPRCHYHGNMKLRTARNRLKSSRRSLARLIRKNYPPSHIERQREVVQRDIDNVYHRMRQYYSTPLARYKLAHDELPKARKDIRHKELAVIRAEDRLSELQKQAKTNKGKALEEQIRVARRKLDTANMKLDSAQGQYARRAYEMAAGHARWERSKANLELQEKRDQALEEGDYAAALYSSDDYQLSDDWESIGITSRPSDQAPKHTKLVKDPQQPSNAAAGRYVHKESRGRGERLVRHMGVETPTFEQYNGYIETRVTYDATRKGYVVVANTYQGKISIPRSEAENGPGRPWVGREALRTVGRSKQPAYQQPPRNQRPDIDQKHYAVSEDARIDPTVSQQHPRGQVFSTAAEAGQYAARWSDSDGPVKLVARQAREVAVRQAMAEAGYKTRESQNSLLQSQREKHRQAEAAGFKEEVRYIPPAPKPMQSAAH